MIGLERSQVETFVSLFYLEGNEFFVEFVDLGFAVTQELLEFCQLLLLFKYLRLYLVYDPTLSVFSLQLHYPFPQDLDCFEHDVHHRPDVNFAPTRGFGLVPDFLQYLTVYLGLMHDSVLVSKKGN